MSIGERDDRASGLCGHFGDSVYLPILADEPNTPARAFAEDCNYRPRDGWGNSSDRDIVERYGNRERIAEAEMRRDTRRAITVFVVILAALAAMALYGYLSGAWEATP